MLAASLLLELLCSHSKRKFDESIKECFSRGKLNTEWLGIISLPLKRAIKSWQNKGRKEKTKNKKQASLSCNFIRSYFSAKLIQTGHLTQIHLFSAANYFFSFFQSKTVDSVILYYPGVDAYRFPQIYGNWSDFS